MVKIKCATCKYYDVKIDKYPCNSCSARNKWINKEIAIPFSTQPVSREDYLTMQLEELLMENTILRRDMNKLKDLYNRLIPLAHKLEWEESKKQFYEQAERQRIEREIALRQYNTKREKIEYKKINKDIDKWMEHIKWSK